MGETLRALGLVGVVLSLAFSGSPTRASSPSNAYAARAARAAGALEHDPAHLLPSPMTPDSRGPTEPGTLNLEMPAALHSSPDLQYITQNADQGHGARAIRRWRTLGLDAKAMGPTIRYALGIASRDLGRPGHMEGHLGAVVEDGGDLADLAAWRLGEAFARPKPKRARRWYRRVRATSPLVSRARVEEARLAMKADEPLAALRALEGFRPSLAGKRDRARAAALRADALQAAGLSWQARQARAELLALHPHHSAANEAAESLPLRERLMDLVDHRMTKKAWRKAFRRTQRLRRAIPEALRPGLEPWFDYVIGWTDIHRRRHGAAEIRFARVLEATDDPELAARALAGRAVSRRRRDLDVEAAADYAAAATIHPDSPRAPAWLREAIFLTHLRSRDDLAIPYCERLLALHGDAQETEHALWTLGWAHYLAERHDEAISVWERLAREHPNGGGWSNGDLAERLRYWISRALEASGRLDEAIGHWGIIVARHPLSYYAHLAYDRLSRHAPALADRYRRREGQGGWPSTWTTRPGKLTLPDDPRVRPAAALIRHGMQREAWRWLHELYYRRNLPEGAIDYTAAMGREVVGVNMGARIELRLATFERLPEEGNAARWELAFPVRYRKHVVAQAERNGIDPYFLLALIRQESGFNPRAVSRRDAIGLTQLLLPTASRTARHYLGERPPTLQDLFIPATNIRIGARFLRTILDRVGDKLVYAPAGYNAGPGAIRTWLKRWGHLEQDEFVEEIPYQEARGYTKLVIQSYGTYRYLYGPRGSEAHRRIALLDPQVASESLVLAPEKAASVP